MNAPMVDALHDARLDDDAVGSLSAEAPEGSAPWTYSTPSRTAKKSKEKERGSNNTF